ncbi:hypothetical protein E4U58_001929, partial [Claviceps cyperi]
LLQLDTSVLAVHIQECKERYWPGKFKDDFLQMALHVRNIFCAHTFINGGLSTEVDVDGEDRSIKLQKLMDNPSCAIITRGTVCYETSEGCVAKFAWAPVKRHPEAGKSSLGIEYTAISSTKIDASSGVAEPDPDSLGMELWEDRIF